MDLGLFPEDLQVSLKKYYPYLMEARKRLLFIVSIFLVSGFFGFFYYERIINIVLDLLNLAGVNIVFTSPFQFFTLAVNSGFLAGTIVALPLIFLQILSFLKPALSDKEYKLILLLVPVAVVLFSGGFVFGVAIMKYVIGIFYQKSIELDIGNLLDISLLLSKIIFTGALMGLAFQFPVVMTILMRLKIVKYKAFIRQRFLAWAVAIIFAALLPPTDVLSLLLLTLPLVLLFELTLLLNRHIL